MRKCTNIKTLTKSLYTLLFRLTTTLINVVCYLKKTKLVSNNKVLVRKTMKEKLKRKEKRMKEMSRIYLKDERETK
jgi:hypothetical protein